MKLFLKFLSIYFITVNLNAQVISAFMENDVIDGEDKHYTNGASFMYLSNKDTNDLIKYDNSLLNFISKIPTFNNNTKYQSLGMNLSHLTFTPENSENTQKLLVICHMQELQLLISFYTNGKKIFFMNMPWL